ncbi:MAG TPA: hypothetical protein VF950_09195 [Planctomycetota bacterium]
MNVLALGLALLAQAAQQPPKPPKQELQVSGHAGFGGVVERGEWTPLTIDLDNRGEDDLDLVLAVTWGQSGGIQDSDRPTLGTLYGKTGPVHRLKASIAARSRKRLSLGVRAPRQDRLNPWVFAESAKTGRTLAAGELLSRSLPAKQRLTVVVGADRLEGYSGFTAQAAPEHLPEDWRAYAAVDTLVWLDAKASDFRSDAQVNALRAWIEFGGRFIVARSSEIGLAGTPVADLLPVTLKGGRPLASLSALGPVGGSVPEGATVVLDSVAERGGVRLVQDGMPLLVEGSVGAGTSIFVAFDPAKEPFAKWPGAARFWAWAAPTRPAPEAAPNDFSYPPESIGAMSLATQAGTFPDVAPPAIGGLFVLILIYLVVVGPFDYFVLRKLKRLELTWITFPAYVVLFTLLILFAGGAFIERAAYQRELVVVDRSSDGARERRRALSAVLAPRNQRYALMDAEPVSANYLTSQLSSLDLGNAVLARAPRIELRDWTVSRGATGLVVTDRAVPRQAPALSWTVREGRLSTKNGGALVRPAALLTKAGAWEVDPIPPGAAEVRIKARGSIADFLKAEKAHAVTENAPPDLSSYRYGYGEDAPRALSVKENALDGQLRRALLALSFGEPGKPVSGFARSLDARRWLDAGGSVLLVWEKPEKAEAEFDPLPTRYTGLTMIRYFQGPPK